MDPVISHVITAVVFFTIGFVIRSCLEVGGEPRQERRERP